MKIISNPFIYGSPVQPKKFIGRKQYIQHIMDRLTSGQSSAITGYPHIGKTSLLLYIEKKYNKKKFSGFNKHFFKYLDCQSLHSVETQTGFWTLALEPINEFLRSISSKKLKSLKKSNSSEKLQLLKKTYQLAIKNKFGTFELEQLFKKLQENKFKFVLILDEFDELLTHPVFHSVEFYGSLRFLASGLPGFVILIAARKNLVRLAEKIRINPAGGSDFLNIFIDFDLGAFTENAMVDLFKLGNKQFDESDKDYIETVSGRHPYLAQAAAATLLNAKIESMYRVECYKTAGHELHNQTKHHFAEFWRCLPDAMRKVITGVAINQIPRLLGKHKFRVSKLVKNIGDYSGETEIFKRMGLLARGSKGEWVVTQVSFLWWLADELKRKIRNETDFETWLKDYHIHGLLTKKQRKRMGKATNYMLKFVGKEATTLIDSFAKGIGEGISKSFLKAIGL